jgi:segregation and condensation protein A
MAIHYKLEIFEGPLDLLLHLIEKAEIDIYDIPISEITDQFLDYLETMRTLDLEPMSEFLVMAATLLSIKSRMLLPKPPKTEEDEFEEEEDPREELVQRLLEYRKYKEIAEQLREMELARSQIYTRPPQDLSSYVPEWTENPLRGILPADLFTVFHQLLKKAEKRNAVAKIRRDEISLKDRIQEIQKLLVSSEGVVRFSALFAERSREQIVVTFLAILELMKRKIIACYQDHLFDEILIVYRGEENRHVFESDVPGEDEGA